MHPKSSRPDWGFIFGPMLLLSFLSVGGSLNGDHWAWALPGGWAAGVAFAGLVQARAAAAERKQRFEDDNYAMCLGLVWVSTGLLVGGGAGMLAAYWDQLTAPGRPLTPMNGMPEWVHGAGGAAVLGGILLPIMGYVFWSRPRLVVGRRGDVWVRNPAGQVIRFHLSEVAVWREVVTVDDEGEEFRDVEVEFTDGRAVRLAPGHNATHFIRALTNLAQDKKAEPLSGPSGMSDGRSTPTSG